jgi:hypothetical protein
MDPFVTYLDSADAAAGVAHHRSRNTAASADYMHGVYEAGGSSVVAASWRAGARLTGLRGQAGSATSLLLAPRRLEAHTYRSYTMRRK